MSVQPNNDSILPNSAGAAEFIDKVMAENVDAITQDALMLRILRANFLSGVSLAVAMIRDQKGMRELAMAQIDGATDLLAQKYNLGVTRTNKDINV